MTVQTLEKEFKTTPHAVETSEARWLHTHLPPLPIENEKDHVLYRRVVDVLMEEGKTGGDFHAYLDAVIHFLDEYEKAQFPTRATPEDVLRFLMEQHDLAQKDLARELGGQSVVSEILSGKRKLTRDHIEKLSRRFSISIVSFFPSARLNMRST